MVSSTYTRPRSVINVPKLPTLPKPRFRALLTGERSDVQLALGWVGVCSRSIAERYAIPRGFYIRVCLGGLSVVGASDNALLARFIGGLQSQVLSAKLV